jgi:hypothetical protein
VTKQIKSVELLSKETALLCFKASTSYDRMAPIIAEAIRQQVKAECSVLIEALEFCLDKEVFAEKIPTNIYPGTEAYRVAINALTKFKERNGE